MDSIEKSPLRALFWKDEILQIMYWMDGEGFGKTVPASQILALLNTNEANLFFHLEKMIKDEVLESEDEQIGKGSMVGLSVDSKKEAGKILTNGGRVINIVVEVSYSFIIYIICSSDTCC